MPEPIVMISSYPPRLCGIGTFAEEEREFIQRRYPDREVLVISHTDGAGEGVFPLMDISQDYWWRPVVEKIRAIKPYAVHIEHEYGLYDHRDDNEGFLALLRELNDWPVIVEPHTVHGRLTEFETDFVRRLCELAGVVLFKCRYQKWRLEWTFSQRRWPIPKNIMIVPHGARPDQRWPVEEVPQLRKDLGLDAVPNLSNHLVGLVGWIQSNKRWDIVTSIWEEVRGEIHARCGEWWDLLAAGSMRDPAHAGDYQLYRGQLSLLEHKGMAHFFEFVPRGDMYYRTMAICDFIILPSIDETQSGTLARIIALNKPYITTAPMEGLTSQTLESGGGLLFTTKDMLRKQIVLLATDGDLRLELGNRLRQYLDKEVSWEVVAEQYQDAYERARAAVYENRPVDIPPEF